MTDPYAPYLTLARAIADKLTEVGAIDPEWSVEEVVWEVCVILALDDDDMSR